jgi:HAD superfamily hydrolase (TIGR01459 family)
VTILTDRFSTLAAHYDVALSDVWGVVHNGLASFPDACDALKRYRAGGGVVILITNAPRPHQAVMRQLEKLAVPRDAYDGIVSSGDVTRAVIASRPGQSIFHMGPARDHSIFDNLGVRFAPLETADYVVCSGLFDDEVETPDDYRDRLGVMRSRNMFMLCGNPDVVVERGNELVYCAGAIADLYVSLGGDVLYAGKPHRPIYDEALRKAQDISGRAAPLSRVLAIGDSVRTDLTGANGLGVDCLFVTAGIHAQELGGREAPDPALIEKIFAKAGAQPKAITRRLVW